MEGKSNEFSFSKASLISFTFICLVISSHFTLLIQPSIVKFIIIQIECVFDIHFYFSIDFKKYC